MDTKQNMQVSETEREFLLESNKIEDVFDEESLGQAIKAWQYLSSQEELTTSVILETHRILMLFQPLELHEKGHFRVVPVWVGGREGIEWREIEDAINAWILDAQTSIKVPGENGEHIKLDHISFERIHPMIDGNGRLGRLLFLWQHVKVGLPIKIIYAKDRQNYYQWFRE